MVVLYRLTLLALQVLILWIKRRVKCRFKRVRVDDSELFEHNKACCGLFVFIVGKLTVAEREKSIFLRQKVWQHLDQVVVLVLVYFILARHTSIHEYVTLAAVPMDVAE